MRSEARIARLGALGSVSVSVAWKTLTYILWRCCHASSPPLPLASDSSAPLLALCERRSSEGPYPESWEEDGWGAPLGTFKSPLWGGTEATAPCLRSWAMPYLSHYCSEVLGRPAASRVRLLLRLGFFYIRTEENETLLNSAASLIDKDFKN